MALASLTHSITHVVGKNGIYAVFLLMAVDAVFPAASELVMVYGGALAAGQLGGHLSFFGATVGSHTTGYLLVAAAGTVGYLVGAWIGWLLGRLAGRPFVEDHANLLHLDRDRLARADVWFQRYGPLAVFLGRLTPLVRSFVSIPAGLQRMPFAPYTVATLTGSAIWCFALAGAGWAAGRAYTRFHHAFDLATIAVVVAIGLALGALLLLERRRKRALTGRASQRDGESR